MKRLFPVLFTMLILAGCVVFSGCGGKIVSFSPDTELTPPGVSGTYTLQSSDLHTEVFFNGDGTYTATTFDTIDLAKPAGSPHVDETSTGTYKVTAGKGTFDFTKIHTEETGKYQLIGAIETDDNRPTRYPSKAMPSYYAVDSTTLVNTLGVWKSE